MSARCTSCRGMGYTFDPRTNHGAACAVCYGTGQVQTSKDIPAPVRAQVRERSGGVCEVCFAQPATDQHHRQYRSRGGAHTVENLLDLCGPGNVLGCHGDAHGPEPLDGVSVSSWITHAHLQDIPFRDKLGRSWLLNTDGTKQLIAVPCQDVSAVGRRRGDAS